MSSPITTHVLDTATGRPAAGLAITLERLASEGGGGFVAIGSGVTDADGRVRDLLGKGELTAGEYRIRFETGDYFKKTGRAGFYPRVEVAFTVTEPQSHHHVPLLLSPFGYSTYRGS